MKTAISGVISLLLACSSGWAQAVSTAQINGTVRDASGLAVPGADVKATQTATGLTRTVTSSPDGSFVLPNLPIGPYMIEVAKQGFSKYVQSGIVLEVASSPTLDATLKVGELTQEVQVEANAALVETHSDNIGTVVNSQSVQELPLNGREVTQLIFLSGMANTGNGTNLNTIRNYPTQLISVAGGQGNGITYLLDGATHNDVMNNLNLPLPFPDALQEFKVESNALPAQYGLHASAAVNAVTKSGTNEFHGDAFEFFRNGDLNARDFFAAARDSLKRNQFGGVLGGPVRKNKLFFFAGYEGTTIRSNPAQTTAFVPTAAELQGNFQVAAGPTCQTGGRTINLPASLGFSNNILPMSLISPIAQNLEKYLPTSNDPCGKTLYGLQSKSNESIGVARIDYQINDRHSVFGRLVFANLNGPGSYNGSNALTFNNAASLDRATAVALGDTYLIGANLVNSFRATITRTRVEKVSDTFVTWAALGVPSITQLVPNFARVTVSGSGFGFGSANETPSKFNTGPTGQGADDVNWVRGNHQLGFGVNYIHEVMDFISGLNTPGGFTFSGQISGLSMADYLLGDASSFGQGAFSRGTNRQNYIGIYAQDSWKVTPRFTVSYGIRWEPYIPAYSATKQVSNFSPALFAQGVHSTIYPNAPAGTLFPGDKGYTAGNAPENATYNLWAPRLGVAWDPFGDGKTSIRAAIGVFTDRQHLFYLDSYANDAPFGNSVTTGAVSFSNPWAATPGGNPFPIQLTPNVFFPLAAGVVSHQLNVKPTILQQWNFNIQRQLGSTWLAALNYVGNETTHLFTGNQENPAVYIPGTCMAGQYGLAAAGPCSSTANTNQRRLLYLENPAQGQYYGAMAYQDSGGTGNYNALYLQLQHRLSKGLTASANYTWSHCISDLENTELGTAGPTYSVPYYRRSDRSNCALSDIRQVFNLTSVYQTPQFSSKVLRWLASDWQVSIAMQAKSAQFFTVTSGIDYALDGQGNERPNLVNTNPYTANQGPSGWIMSSAFANPATGTVRGNLGANNLRGPTSLQVDMALVRRFRIWEKTMLQARFEAFNLPNLVNFSSPVSALNASNFGQITGDISGSQAGGLVANSGDPRILQIALKYVF